jgi:hypothetical protein
MKLAVATIVALYIGSLSGLADPSEAAQAFLRVEGSQWAYSTGKEEHFKRSVLPKELWKVVEGYFRSDGTSREEFVGFTHDLNGDGKKEYFIRTPLGGSAGPYFTVVSQREGKWVEIASFQGGFHLLRAKDGWMQIVGYSRGGADNYYKFRMEFRRAAYHEVWVANFSDGKVIEEKIEQ